MTPKSGYFIDLIPVTKVQSVVVYPLADLGVGPGFLL